MDDEIPQSIKVEVQIKVEDDCKPLAEVPLAEYLVNLEGYETAEVGPRVPVPLVAYSSSPPPVTHHPTSSVSDQNGFAQSTLHYMRNQLDLSSYEYAALEERYHSLLRQHSSLKRLTTLYNELIYGTPVYEQPDVGLEQLRADAGSEGLRAKAREADALRPVIQDAGGVQAVTFLTKSVRTLIDQAGSLENLKEIVLDTTMTRLRVQQLGGLQGLDQLVADGQSLAMEHRAFNDLTRNVEGPNGLRAKALKYDQLHQVFAAIERAPSGHHIQPSGSSATSTKRKRTARKRDLGSERIKTDALPPISIQNQNTRFSSWDRGTNPSSERDIQMNPARAQLLSSTSMCNDPDRDLYEPKPPPIRNPDRGRSANDEPLGRPRSRVPSVPTAGRVNPTKRDCEDTSQVSVAKRPRVDVGRASALVQATLAAGGNTFCPYPLSGKSKSVLNHGGMRSDSIRPGEERGQDLKQRLFVQGEVDKLIESRGEIGEEVAATSDGTGQFEDGNRIRPLYRDQKPLMENVEPVNSLDSTRASTNLTASISKEQNAVFDARRSPIILWAGRDTVSERFVPATDDFIKAEKISPKSATSLPWR